METIIYNYITTNKINGKQYVGTHSTTVVDDNYLGSGIAILKAIKKYGRDNFTREILLKCETLDEALVNESGFIEQFKTLFPIGYNISPTGGTKLNGSHSEVTKQKISKRRKGKFPSEEARNKVSLAKKGKPRPSVITEEGKQRISVSNSGENNGMYGTHPTPWNKGLTKETDDRVKNNYK